MKIRRVFTFVLSFSLFWGEWARAQAGPSDEFRKLQQNVVAAYFTESEKQGSIDPRELDQFEHDLTKLAKQAQTLGAPYSEDFLRWLAKPQEPITVQGLRDIKGLTIDPYLMNQYLNYRVSILPDKEDPLAIMNIFKGIFSNKLLRHAVSSASYYLVVILGIGFCSTVVGTIVYAFFGHMAEPLAGKAGVLGARIWRRPSVALQKSVNLAISRINDVHYTIEVHGVTFPGMSRADMEANMKFFIGLWAEANNFRNAIFTGGLTPGRSLVTEALHWRENHLAQMISIFKAEANTNENLIETRVSRILSHHEKPNHEKIEDLVAKIQEQNGRRWEFRAPRFASPDVTSEMESTIIELKELGIRDSDIAYIIENSNARVIAGEKVAAGLALQIVQDIMYPEYNRLQTPKLRNMQRVIRTEYRIQTDLQKFQDQVVRNLRDMGLQVNGDSAGSMQLEFVLPPEGGEHIVGILRDSPELALELSDHTRIRVQFKEGLSYSDHFNQPVAVFGSFVDENILSVEALKPLEVQLPEMGSDLHQILKRWSERNEREGDDLGAESREPKIEIR